MKMCDKVTYYIDLRKEIVKGLFSYIFEEMLGVHFDLVKTTSSQTLGIRRPVLLHRVHMFS